MANASKAAPAQEIADEWMSAREAAARLGCARPTVSSYALRGALEFQHVAGRTVYSRASVERLAIELGRA